MSKGQKVSWRCWFQGFGARVLATEVGSDVTVGTCLRGARLLGGGVAAAFGRGGRGGGGAGGGHDADWGRAKGEH